jgi:tRNA (Thr-GGU) A37 N-methylase
MRNILEGPKPYKKSPAAMGIFATRSPVRPNLIALTAVQVISIDYEKGNIEVAYIDANDGTPVLDIKPYTPSLDRVEKPSVPKWCGHWPMSLEQSEDFDWENEMNF